MKRDKEILSEKEIKDYLNKNTPSDKVHSIKEKVSSDPFYAEAMEGFENFPDEIKNIGRVKNSVRNKLFDYNYSYIYLSAAAIGIVVATYLFFIYNKPIDKNITENSTLQEAPAKVQELSEKENLLSANEITNLQQEPTGIVLKDDITSQKSNDSNPISDNSKENQAKNIAQLNKIDPPVVIPSELKENSYPKTNLSYNFPVDYMRELKIADYTKNEMRKQKISPILPSNIEAQYSSKTESVNSMETIRLISYHDFLNETMGHFNSGDYKASIIGFKTIEKHYPEDLNAWFYTGLSYYNLGLADKAILYFKKAENSYINIFDEEAQWYHALSYELKNDKENAALIFEKIIQKEGFYAEKALKKLKR
ncbi:MAG: tetratricopeptide repeat protein [Bacteroidota bacterium]|nr:tetratricopeptide repeat protein [Bacteroidota bacterium]